MSVPIVDNDVFLTHISDLHLTHPMSCNFYRWRWVNLIPLFTPIYPPSFTTVIVSLTEIIVITKGYPYSNPFDSLQA